jgi:predicted Zn-ribbon and HTH transcriptional regulator
MESKSCCRVCGAALLGRQRLFFSRRCKNTDTNTRHQNYAAQQARGLRRKLTLLAEAGARCRACGYDRNLAALVWHHRDPRIKSFSLDLRALSNRSEEELRVEAAKCDVLCANCHAETHFPQCGGSSCDKSQEAHQPVRLVS